MKISWYYCQGHLLNVGTTLNVVDCFLPCFLGRAFLYYGIVQHSSSPKGHNHLVNIFCLLRLRGQDVFINLSRLASPVGYLVGCGVYVLRAVSFVKQ